MYSEYFLIVFPLYGNISKMKVGKYGLKISRLDSPYFAAVLNDPGFKRIGEDVKRKLDYIAANSLQDHCYIISTKSDYNNLWLLHNLLLIIKPSNFQSVCEVSVNFITQRGKKTLWQTTSVTDYQIDVDKALDKTLIMASNFDLFEKLLDAYADLSNRTALNKIIQTYFDAAQDNKPHTKFIMLMMIIETLLGDDKEAGINYKIRRTCAVFLGEHEEMSKTIYSNVNKIYVARSKLVHNADYNAYTDEMLEYLHHMVCEVLNTLLLSKIKFGDVFKIANEYGYGQRKALLKTVGVTKDMRFIDNYSKLGRVVKAKK